MRGYFNHGARHHPLYGSDPVPISSGVIEVAYYEISGVASGSHPGTVFYTMSLTSTSDAATFDTSSGYARILATGVYSAYAFIDYGATETFTAGAITEYRFGIDFASFPFYTVGGPVKTFPIPTTLGVYDVEVTGEFVMDAASRSLRLFARGPSVSPSPSPTGYLVIKRIRAFDWTW